jgi:hypothetical protein
LSSHSRLRPSAPAAVLTLILALSGAVAHAAHRPQPQRVAPPVTLPAAADDSSAAAHEMLAFVRGVYGGQDNWANIDGWRYYITYRLFGPDTTKVGEWTEAHMVWAKGTPRIRIDNSDDSTVVVVTGDTTYVRRGGAWSTDPAVVAQARALALQNVWLLRMPWNLLDFRLVRRLDPPYVKDGPLSVRIDFGPGQDLPAGTRAWVRFEPPSYAIRSVRWYDPVAKGWYLLELSNDQQRYGWTWAGRRTLRASDSDGRPGPIILDATVGDMQIDNAMPLTVLSPPGGTPVRTAAPDSARAR